MSNTHIPNQATLYVVSTPIGNLGDMSKRAVEVLMHVDLIAVEDTRHSGKLMANFGIETRLIPYHDHSDERVQRKLMSKLENGQSIALISDAGTPLIADPGYRLVKLVRKQGFSVVPIPGASALTAALSASGLPTDRFVFEGFLPSKAEARKKYLESLINESRTLVFYEAPHRVLESLRVMVAVFGDNREAVLARELTKRYETITDGTLGSLLATVTQDENQQRGEIVLVVAGVSQLEMDQSADFDAKRVLGILLTELSVKQSAVLTAKLTGAKKNYAYELALQLDNK